MCGLPTFMAVPPICLVLFLSKISIFKFCVSCCSLKGISCQLTFGTPISVSTKLLSKIYDFREPEAVKSVISFLPLSFDRRSATHLVPFPQAPDALPSEL